MSTETTERVSLTAGQLRAALAKAKDVLYWTETEATDLRYGTKRVAERIAELDGNAAAIRQVVGRVEDALAEAAKLPRGRRVSLDPPRYPEYNRHRRLAVMERSFL